jgi:hypothetical protein
MRGRKRESAILFLTFWASVSEFSSLDFGRASGFDKDTI